MSAPCPLSIVVISLVGGAHLDALVARLSDAATMPPSAEIVVVAAGAPSPGPAAARVRWVVADSTMSVPRRRMLGIAGTSAKLVGILEDTVLPDAGWGHAVIALHARHPEAQAIGGTLRLDPAIAPRPAALSCLDYGPFLQNTALGREATTIPGNDMSFKRGALDDASLVANGLREAELVPRLARQAGGVRVEPAMGATCVTADERGMRLSSRFQHGRLYAGNRLAEGHRLERLARAATAPALAGVLARRGLSVLASQRAEHPALVVGHLIAMAAAWSLGEAAGYLTGAGDAERHWT